MDFQRAIACCALAALGGTAQASINVIGPLDLLPDGYSTSIAGLAGAFSEVFPFELAQDAQLSASVYTSFFARSTAAGYVAVTDVQAPSMALMYSADGSFNDGVVLASASVQTVGLAGGTSEVLQLSNVDLPATGGGLSGGVLYLQISGVGVGSLGGSFNVYAVADPQFATGDSVVAVPELSVNSMLALGLAGLLLVARRRAR